MALFLANALNARGKRVYAVVRGDPRANSGAVVDQYQKFAEAKSRLFQERVGDEPVYRVLMGRRGVIVSPISEGAL